MTATGASAHTLRRRLAILAAVLTALACATTSAASWPPWTTISRGSGPVAVPGGGNVGGALISSRAQLNAYPYLTMHPGHAGCCDWYQIFDWRRRAVVVVVATLPHEFDIQRLTRRSDTLRVQIGRREQQQPDFGTAIISWQAISVSRALLGRPLPRRIVVTIT